MNNSTAAESNTTFLIWTENSTLSSLLNTTYTTILLTTTTTPPSAPLTPSYSSDIHDPEFTIMIVLGLSLLLAGVAAFIVVCQPSKWDGDSDSYTHDDSFRSRSKSGEPQLKHWKRFGSYRRSYSASFRRPPHKRHHERQSVKLTQPQATRNPQKEANDEVQPTTPCLCDYVTEI